MKLLSNFDCRFVTKEVQQASYNKMTVLANSETSLLTLNSLLQHCTELEISDEKLTE